MCFFFCVYSFVCVTRSGAAGGRGGPEGVETGVTEGTIMEIVLTLPHRLQSNGGVVSQLCYSGVTVALPWCCSGATSGVTVVLQWRHHGDGTCSPSCTPVPQWCYSGVTVV
jgi:hypothetical protein